MSKKPVKKAKEKVEKVEKVEEDMCACCGQHPIEHDDWCAPCMDAGCHEGDGPKCSEPAEEESD
jgi:hypothetical protein